MDRATVPYRLCSWYLIVNDQKHDCDGEIEKSRKKQEPIAVHAAPLKLAFAIFGIRFLALRKKGQKRMEKPSESVPDPEKHTSVAHPDERAQKHDDESGKGERIAEKPALPLPIRLGEISLPPQHHQDDHRPDRHGYEIFEQRLFFFF